MRRFETINDMKKVIYLCVLPLIIAALILSTIAEGPSSTIVFDRIINSTLIVYFTVSWVLLYKNRWVRFAEYSNLALISFYFVSTFYEVVHDYMAVEGGPLGDFIIWMPLFTMFIYFTLGLRKGLYYALFILLINLVNGFMCIKILPRDSIDSLTQFYFASLVYMILLFFIHLMFRNFARIQIIKRHAYFDSLTGVANRHQIDEWLDSKLLASQSSGKFFSIIFFDIDHFKQINDCYGHKVGDLVLIELAKLIQENLFQEEPFGRWGGEEFMVISDKTGDRTAMLAERLRKAVENHLFKEVGNITASFGFTDYMTGDTVDSLLIRADKGLYRSKNNGRNQCNRHQV